MDVSYSDRIRARVSAYQDSRRTRRSSFLVEAGFTPVDAIRIATLEGATFLGIDDRVGSIARGKEADLLIVRGDPSTNIQDLSNVSHVFANGKLHDPQALLSAVTGQFGWR